MWPVPPWSIPPSPLSLAPGIAPDVAPGRTSANCHLQITTHRIDSDLTHMVSRYPVYARTRSQARARAGSSQGALFVSRGLDSRFKTESAKAPHKVVQCGPTTEPSSVCLPAMRLARPLTRNYSHSMVAGGLEDTSYTTRLTPWTSLMIRLAILPSSSWSIRTQSAVMKSELSTNRTATTCWPA